MFQKLSLWILAATLASNAWAEDAPLPPLPPVETPPAAQAEPPRLTLDMAIERAIANAPLLKSATSARSASMGEQDQAGLLPNPEIGIEAENIAGQGAYRGTDSAEITLGVSQQIELGGKRESRMKVAAQETALRGFEYEAARLDLIRDVTIAYAETVAAQEDLKLAGEQKALADDLLKEVSHRVGEAREPLIQRSKAEITASTADFAHARAEREFDHAQHVLASLWGGHHETFLLESERFFELTPPKAEAEIEAALAVNPDIKRWEAERERGRARLDAEKAQAIPDPVVSVGVRDFRESGDRAMVAGFSIPIPVFNRNQGNIQKALHEINKAESDAAATALVMRNTAFQALEDMINAHAQAESLKSTIVPAAEKAFQLAREGYRAGKFAYLEVLDSQRTLFETRTQYIAALRDYHKARAQVERLTAHSIKTASNEAPHE